MLDPELLERITARRAELDELEEQLANQLAEVRAERDELAVAERVLERMTGQLAEERSSARPMPGGRTDGDADPAPRARRGGGRAPVGLPAHHRRRAAGRRAGHGPRGQVVGVDTSVKAKLEPLRSKLVRLVDRGWLRKLPDGRFTTRL
ncbi:hypothetical protein [Streptomyces sp. NRRL S-4]|uniref:hypothetical protein n=1 Tax=Streptomyces sp. NRRL S-4 TaxID=1519471 RepID=UPI000AB37936|nr:hypothetical protein [Streptomyces sp. NRRL S-4]